MDRGSGVLALHSELESTRDKDGILLIAEYSKWRVRELQLTPEKLAYIWEQMQLHKALFSDMTRDDKINFRNIITSKDTFWMEVLDDQDNLIGLIYLMNMQWVIDAEAHIVFFDRQPAEKALLCRQVIQWLFENFPFHRLSATIPSIYFATIRLAKKIGFKDEGIKRESQLIGNKWVHEEMLGILRAEVL